MIAPHVLEELSLHLDGEYPADSIGKVRQSFLLCLTLRHTARQINTLSDPSAVDFIALSQGCEVPGSRGRIFVSPRLKLPKDPASGLEDCLHERGLRPACSGGVVGHLKTS